MKFLKTYKLFESNVDEKILLLKDLALDLEDAGLEVEVIDGFQCGPNSSSPSSRFFPRRSEDDWDNFIILTVVDYEGKISDDLFNTNIIDEFKETLKSYGMTPSAISSGYKFVSFRFNKDNEIKYPSILKESVLDTKEEIDEVVATCKDIMMDIDDLFKTVELGHRFQVRVPFTVRHPRVVINCSYHIEGGILGREKYLNNKELITEVHQRLIEFMKSEGFKQETHQNYPIKDFFTWKFGNLTYSIDFYKDLDPEFAAHIRYLKKYNLLKESVELDLRDILLDLQDLGYRIEHEEADVKAIVVKDNMRPSERVELPWSELKEYALRIKDYLGDKYLSFEWKPVVFVRGFTGVGGLNEVELNDDTQINGRIWSFVIKYKD